MVDKLMSFITIVFFLNISKSQLSFGPICNFQITQKYLLSYVFDTLDCGNNSSSVVIIDYLLRLTDFLDADDRFVFLSAFLYL